MSRTLFLIAAFLWVIPVVEAENTTELLSKENLVAWCVVPFDASKRGPEERAAMLADLGLMSCAYDWRPGDESTFEAEIEAYQENGIEMFAFWRGHELAYDLFRKHGITPQLWRTAKGGGNDDPEDLVQAVATVMESAAVEAASYGGKLGLYNHGGPAGEPETLVAVCEELRRRGHSHVGIVYNFHHAHDQIDRWAEVFPKMVPYLLCLNINGMTSGEVTKESKVLLLGEGDAEAAMLEVVLDSSYNGPIGILDHENETDTRETLTRNLEGLRRLEVKLKR